MLVLLVCSGWSWMAAAQAQQQAAPTAKPATVLEADIDARENQALADWSAGRYNASLQHWNELIAARPDVQAYRIGLVRTLVSAGAVTRARRALEAARRMPVAGRSDQYNLLVAEGEVLQAEEREDEANAAFRAAADISGRSTRARQYSGPGSRAQKKPWRLNAGMVLDHFDNERGSENQSMLDLGYRVTPALFVYGVYEHHRRFDTVDDVYLAGVSAQLGDDFSLRMNVGGSPQARFRPRTEGSAKLEWRASDRVRPQFGYQLLDYEQGQVSTLTPGLRLLIGSQINLELEYALTDEIDGSNSRIGGLKVDWIASPHWLPSFSYYRGEEALPPQIRADFQRLGLGLTWIASREWLLRANYVYEDREDFYIGQSLSLGVGINF